MSFSSDERAVNPIPPLILALFVVAMGVEVMFQLGTRGIIGGPSAVGWRQAALTDYGFQGQYARFMVETGQLRPEFLLRFVSYPFVHLSFTQALIAGVMLLALGKFVGEIMHPFAVFVLYVLSTIGGALAMWALAGDSEWLFGGFPPVYGLIGGFTYLLWVRLGAVGASQVQAFRLIAVLAGLQFLFGVLFGFAPDWPADLGGFVFGFALSPLLVPGGLSALVTRLRKRG
ncbi:Rhomboid family protein [Pseudooceanicola nitratireducens]|jgi:membrane associated rhomboid family serine protease|uniref:Rhomboid family protein n=1 Tax=Pseudooceanicola nitratireducens TaxID=517719 RepID=A0A1I1JMJ5_9RHOB|nr:rhomboid family intramembrane serine protease [Pseudooceanicola nitratireducens]MEC7795573.1 rhomboid family intramembrane serine protease [Pseudomonadota bacterium]SEJ53619.1 Rhomboid family protein [Pseudooceanicola nitratireducens]SFC49696.1 Rhomboid family protein [Pseudooceanicola nitratireducens]